MKKFVFMFLALAMCLSLAAPAFAAEEETEATNEAAAQKEICQHIDYKVTHGYEVDPDNYDGFCHARYYMRYKTCLACDEIIGSDIISVGSEAHKLYKASPGVIIDDGSGPVTVYQYACRQCNYTHIGT